VHRLPPGEYRPAGTSSQPSSEWVAPVLMEFSGLVLFLVAMVPSGHVMSIPPTTVKVLGDYFPHCATVHPSVNVVDPVIVAYSPRAQFMGVQLSTTPPSE